VVRLVPRPLAEIGIVDATMFATVVRAAFSQRRKTLRNALSTVCDATQIEAAGIDPGARAETVAVPAFVALANRLAAARTQAVAN
jgi:16S rRNA (adenine1518-N6/adenine1519-N6)-dimethyltransferase